MSEVAVVMAQRVSEGGYTPNTYPAIIAASIIIDAGAIVLAIARTPRAPDQSGIGDNHVGPWLNIDTVPTEFVGETARIVDGNCDAAVDGTCVIVVEGSIT